MKSFNIISFIEDTRFSGLLHLDSGLNSRIGSKIIFSNSFKNIVTRGSITQCPYNFVPVNTKVDFENQSELIEEYNKYSEVFFEIYSRKFDFPIIIDKKSVYSNFYQFAIQNMLSTDIVLFADIPHSAHEFMHYIIAKRMSIRTIFINRNFGVKGEDRINYYFSSDWFSYPNSYLKFKDNIATNDEKSLYEDLSSFYKKIFDNFKSYETDSDSNDRKEIKYMPTNKSIRQRIRFLIDKVKLSIYNNQIPLVPKKVIHFVSLFIEFIEIRKLINKYFNYEPDLSKKFIYFPLQFQPEATSVPAAGNFSDQYKTISILSSLIPSDYHIYVKEHPAYFMVSPFDLPESIKKYRNNNFYRSLSKIRNVRLVNTFFDSYKLLEKSQFAATLTGTIALESLYFSKMCLTFGISQHNILPNTVTIEDYLKNFNLSMEINGKLDLLKHLKSLMYVSHELRDYSNISLKSVSKNLIFYLDDLFEKSNNNNLLSELFEYSTLILKEPNLS